MTEVLAPKMVLPTGSLSADEIRTEDSAPKICDTVSLARVNLGPSWIERAGYLAEPEEEETSRNC